MKQQSGRLGDRADHQGLTKPRHPLEQHMPPGHHAGEQLVHDAVIANDALADLIGQQLVVLLELCDAVGAELGVHAVILSGVALIRD
jgi:hypothetical protein